ncbi:efflux RND transporter periplasmic adaptor subunit [Rhodoblastus sp.]|uniref:efflux RND transporter periplasmic adaptor subunit n=1 Tax=Rhodoblastus sp. TaxID=1962975 RepID=UPI002603C29F|nr:efflux RND transporter periplasmic adaptor subunit [Rhodoblastus sp.]
MARVDLGLAPFRVLAALLAAATLLGTPQPSAAAGNELALTPDQVKQLDIKLTDVRVATKSLVATLPATIIPPLNTRIAITAPFAGTVVAVKVLPGQTVHQGEPLVVLASRDVMEAMVRLRQAEAELQAAEAIARRQRELFQKNLVSTSKVAEADAQVEKIRALVSESRRLLAIGDIKLNADGGYSLTAPKDGRVVEIKAAPGAALQAMDAALVVDTSRELWLQAQLPGNMVGAVAVGDRIELPNGDAGKVISVGIALDPLTRSTTLLAQIPASPEHISGQSTSITIVKVPAQQQFEIDADAISFIGGKAHVFVETKGGFTPTPVVVKGRTATVATVEGDLQQGQRLAISGLAQLEKMMSGE